MRFNTSSKTERPKRLNENLRKWAWESMHGKYGDDALKTDHIEIKDDKFSGLSNYDKYDIIIEKIASEAPIRICDDELVSGSATLGAAINHVIPVFYEGKPVYSSISHLTIDYETTLKYGIDYYERKITERIKDKNLSNGQRRFLESLNNVIKSIKTYHARYLEATKDKKPEIYSNLLQVPFKPARNFYEAVQSIWFVFSFVRLCGNWPGIGRIDKLLGEYYENDVKNGILTKERAREILASFFIKGTEWIQSETPVGSGDAQHYQNIVLAGVDENGREVTNDVTYLVLDIIEELGISDFPVTIRVNEKTSEKLVAKAARVVRHGGGVVAFYGEPTVLKALTDFGYPLKEARNFANDGCWEVQVPGKTYFCYCPFDGLAVLQHITLKNYEDDTFRSFEELYCAYIADIDNQVNGIYENCKIWLSVAGMPDGEWDWMNELPTSVVSLFEGNCIDAAHSYFGGAEYTVFSPHFGGIADAVNSLYAIKKLVFDENKISMHELLTALRNDWKGYEPLRAYARSFGYYGTDNDETDELYSRILHDFYLSCRSRSGKAGFLFPAGISTFGREIEWAPNRLASPHGEIAGAILAGNTSPTPGTDTSGVTAVIRSYCKADLSEMTTGAALDLKITPRDLAGKQGIEALKSLIRGFVSLGGFFVQIDAVNAETLRKAQENPREYKTLSVRVSGWNARFITLSKEWQDMVIQRTEHDVR